MSIIEQKGLYSSMGHRKIKPTIKNNPSVLTAKNSIGLESMTFDYA